MSNLRKRILSSRAYSPQWSGFIEGYVTNFLHKNYWRVQTIMQYEDCVQEAKLKFWKLKKKYGNLDTPQHFMALYKISWENTFKNFSNIQTKRSFEVCEQGDDYEDTEESLSIGDLDNDGVLAVMVRQAPSEVKQVLELFLTTPVELLDMVSSAWKTQGRHKEYGNNHLCELLGLPKKTDVIGIVSSYFQGK